VRSACSAAACASLRWRAHGRRQAATAFPGIGRAATPKEVAAWDIDVRPDFKGLPEGSGTVASGMEMWEAKCASCHGVFGESNEVFSPLIGGTTAEDIASRPRGAPDRRRLPGPHDHDEGAHARPRCGTTSTAPCPGTRPSR
jgi:mono/diheme cytochrome c family protein